MIVSDVEFVEHVLSTNSSNYAKERDEFLTQLVGNGLLVSQGDFWRKQRKLLMPGI